MVANRSLRLVMLSGQFMPEVYGGAEQQCDRLSRALVARGHEVTILTSRSHRDIAPDEQHHGVRIQRFFSVYDPQLLGRYTIGGALWAHHVQQWFRKNHHRVDVMHAHQFKFPAYVGAQMKRRHGTPLIVKPGNAGTQSDFLRLRTKAWFGGHLYRIAIAEPSRFVAISSEIAREIQEHGIEKHRAVAIPNGIDDLLAPGELPERRRAARARLGAELPPGTPVFIFVGRLAPVKNVPVLLEAFARLSREPHHPAPVLWLAGTGGEESRLREMTRTLGLASRVRFLGYLANVREHLLAADYFVLASLAEGLSNALLEAMAVGTVPVSTPVSGSTDLVADGRTGYLARNFTSDALHATLQAAMSGRDAHAVLSRRCITEIATRYDMRVVAAQYETIYRETIAESKRHHEAG